MKSHKLQQKILILLTNGSSVSFLSSSQKRLRGELRDLLNHVIWNKKGLLFQKKDLDHFDWNKD